MRLPAPCNLHGPHRYRPNVERFDAQQQAAFQRFCASLLQLVTAPPPSQRAVEPSAGSSAPPRFQ